MNAVFEMVGNRRRFIMMVGWLPRHARRALALGAKMPELATITGIYNVAKDFSENNDLARSQPISSRKCRRCSDRGGKIQCLPLDNSGFVRLLAPKPSGNRRENRVYLYG